MQKARCSREIKQISLFFPAEKMRVQQKKFGKTRRIQTRYLKRTRCPGGSVSYRQE